MANITARLEIMNVDAPTKEFSFDDINPHDLIIVAQRLCVANEVVGVRVWDEGRGNVSRIIYGWGTLA